MLVCLNLVMLTLAEILMLQVFARLCFCISIVDNRIIFSWV